MNPAPIPPTAPFTPAGTAPVARAPMKPLDEALTELLARALPLPGFEAVSTFDADGRVLAQDLVSSLDVPALDNSSMDGYAVRCADWPAPPACCRSTSAFRPAAAGARWSRSVRREFSPAPRFHPAPMPW